MRTVLCISENPSTLISVYSLIHTRGHQCITAASLKEAENSFVLNTVDLVIIDQGRTLETNKIAMHLKKIRRVKVLLLAKDVVSEGYPKVPDLVVRKPFEPDQLVEAVVRLLARE
jgi:DNA-binding response OmpR family regulator